MTFNQKVYCHVCGADITRLLKFYDGVVGSKQPYCYDCWEKHKKDEKLRKEQQKAKIEKEIREYRKRRKNR